MASLADVFTEKERTNWLKAWLAVDIAKSGLDQLAGNEAKTIHANIYTTVWSSVKAPASCFGCHTANLLKCPTQGICNKSGANSTCKAMHDSAAKQPQPCPTNVCNKVLDEIKQLHKFPIPSWKNTRAEQWASNPWQIAKAYLPPDGYIGKSSVQDTDFNGIISFMMNCKHFDSKFSFHIAPGKSYPPCLLTKAREIGRTVRHSSQCKLTDPDLLDMFTTLTSLLTDPTCLAQDVASQEAVKKLAKLQNDRLKITTEEMINLLAVAQDKLKEVENIAENTLYEIRVFLEHCMNDLKEYTEKCEEKLDERTDNCEDKLDEHTEKCVDKLDEHTEKCEEQLDEHTEKCEEQLDEHTEKCVEQLDEHTEKCEEQLDEHTEKCVDKLDEHTEKCEEQLDEHTEKCEEQLDEHTEKCEEQLDEHTEKCVDKLDEHTEKCEEQLDEHTDKCEEKLVEHTDKCEEKLDEHTEICEKKLNEHTEKLKNALDERSRKPAESSYEQSCEDFRRRLIEHYKDTSSNIPLSTLDQNLDKRITDIYATPKIHRIDIKKDGTRKKEEQISSYKKMFYRNDHANIRIYVQGEPGSGKSTFAAKLVHDWCHGNQPPSTAPTENTSFNDVTTIQKFKFLFFISLRDSRGQTDITEMIKTQLVKILHTEDELNDVYKLFQKIMKTEQCLLVRDGLDEWVAPDGCNLAEPSMSGFHKDKWTILTTARPWKLSDERIRNSQIDILLEIDGIANPDKFCEKILGCIIDEDKDLVKTLDTFHTFVKRRKLLSLSSSPMLYTVVICMWVDTVKEEEQLQESSLCALYTILLESLCKKANSTAGYFNDSNPSPVECFSSTRYLQPNIAHLDKLAAAACKLLFSFERATSIVFSDITLSNYISREEFTVCKTFALKAGILTNRKDKSRTGSSNSFIHKTMQEFLAAYYIARNARAIDDIIDGYLKHFTNSYLDISQVFIFLCGMNIVAANALSGLMNECDIAHCESPFKLRPSKFQKIILNGFRESAANTQDGIYPKLSRFYIQVNEIQYVHRIWSTLTSNVQSLVVDISSTRPNLSLLEIGQPKCNFELNLASCDQLKRLTISDCGILPEGEMPEDFARLPISEFLVRNCLNNTDPAQCGDPHPVLPSIEYIELSFVNLSTAWLRSLFSTLLTLDHAVMCKLVQCGITSSVEGADREKTYATIKVGLNNAFHIHNDIIKSGFWKTINGLNIKWLCISGLNKKWKEHESGSFLKSLQSLPQLDTLNIRMETISPNLWEALHSLTIKSVTLSLKDACSGLIINDISRLSQVLISPTKMERIYIDVNVHPDLLEALCGLNIKSISLCGRGENLKGNHVSAFLKMLSSLKKLDKLDVIMSNDSPGLWKALHGLNIKSLSLNGGNRGVILNHVSAFAQLLASLIRLETLSITALEDNISLLETLHGLNITCLCLRWSDSGGEVNRASTLSLSLASLTRLETLNIEVLKDSQCLWETIHGLNITCLCLRWNHGIEKKNIESMLQSLSSLKLLETLSIKLLFVTNELWQSLKGLNIKNLSLSGLHKGLDLVYTDSLSQSISSLTQLETLTLYLDWFKYEALQLPQSVKYLSIYVDSLRPFKLRDCVSTLSSLTQRVEIKLEFGCPFNELCTATQHELETMGNVKVTRFLIYTWKPSIETGSDWCVQNVVVDVDGHLNDDIGDDELYKQFIDHVDELNRISMRLRIN